MRIRVSKPGIYGNDGEIPVGTEFTVKEAPIAWGDRYDVIGDTGDKEFFVNPDKTARAGGGFEVKEKERGWFVITDGGEEVTKSLRKNDVEGFMAMTDDQKAKFVQDNAAED